MPVLNMKEHHHQLQRLRVKGPVLRPPNRSESVVAIAEARGVGIPIKGNDAVEEVGTRRGQGKPSPRNKSAEKQQQVHHASNSHVLSSKIDHWEILRNRKCGLPDLHVNGRKCPVRSFQHEVSIPCPDVVRLHVELLSTTRMGKAHASRTIGGLATAKKVMKHGLAKLSFASSRNTRMAMSAERKNSFQVSFDKRVKNQNNFMLIMTCLNMNMLNTSLSKCYPKAQDCPKPKEADLVEAIRCAKSLSLMLENDDPPPKCDFSCDHQPLGPSDLCCRHCRVTSKEETPKYARASATPARVKGTRWLGDTGADQDIVGESQQVVTQSRIRDADVNITLATANGPITADRSIDTPHSCHYPKDLAHTF